MLRHRAGQHWGHGIRISGWWTRSPSKTVPTSGAPTARGPSVSCSYLIYSGLANRMSQVTIVLTLGGIDPATVCRLLSQGLSIGAAARRRTNRQRAFSLCLIIFNKRLANRMSHVTIVLTLIGIDPATVCRLLSRGGTLFKSYGLLVATLRQQRVG